MLTKQLAAGLVLTCFTALSANAALASSTHPSQAQLRGEIQKINGEMEALESQVHTLQKQLHTPRVTHRKKQTHRRRGQVVTTITDTSGHPHYPLIRTRFHHPITVTTSPLMGLHSAFDASDVLQQAATMNQDLTLLQQRHIFIDELAAEGSPLTRPVIELSGGVEAQIYNLGNFGRAANDKGIALDSAEFVVNAVASHWVNGFMAFDFSNAPIALGARQPSAQVYLSRGFLTVGNLDVSGLYGTIGLMYAPFGRFSTNMLNSPLTKSLARIRTPVALIGYFTHGFYVNAFGYNGNQASGSNNTFKQGGASAGYKGAFIHHTKVQVAASVITNIADSQGMQGNGLTAMPMTFAGFGATAGGNNLMHRVPGIDGNASITIGPLTLLSEYVGALIPFNPADLTFNGGGAQPQALHLEAQYLVHIFARPFTLGFAYGHAWQALALNLPEDSFSVMLNFSLWKNTIEAIQYRHALDYAAGNTAGGRGATPAGIVATGGTRNAIIGQIGVYF